MEFNTDLTFLSTLLTRAAETDASDLHIRGGRDPFFRRGSTFGPDAGIPVLTNEQMRILHAWYEEQRTDKANLSVSVSMGEHRWRMTGMSSSDGWSATFRYIPRDPPPIDMLGLPDSIGNFTRAKSGLMIICGGTGSGKTTTAASLLRIIARERECHIVTIENPIEYAHRSEKAWVTQRSIPEAGQDQALALAMRSDPDVVLFGECIRQSHFTGCMTLAATGHLVITTLHARNAAAAVSRIANICGDTWREPLAQTLLAVISQQLLPDIETPTSRWLAAEVVTIDFAKRSYLLPGGDIRQFQSAVETAREDMDVALAKLVHEGKVAHSKAETAAIDTARFEEEVKRLRRI